MEERTIARKTRAEESRHASHFTGLALLVVLCVSLSLWLSGKHPTRTRALTLPPGQLTVDGSTRVETATHALRFERISVEQGLSQSIVFAILQDRLGFVWFGTRNGLNRYDGRTFTIYRHDPEDASSLSDSAITTLYEDQAGVLWVGTFAGGLNRFDRAAGTFIHYEHEPGNPASLSHNNVYAIYEDKEGELWVGTYGGGLDRFEPDTESFVRYQHDPGDSNSLSDDVVYTIHEDSSGALWIGTQNGLDRFDKATGVFRHYQYDPDDADGLSHPIVMSVCDDRAGNLWVGTYGGGLNKLDRTSGTFTQFRHNPDDPHSLSDDTIFSVYVDQRDRLWVATESGLNRFDPVTATFERHRNNAGNPNSLSSDRVWTIYQDRAGVLWIGTFGGGVNKFNPSTEAFKHYLRDPDNSNTLSDNYVSAMLEDRNGLLWLGTQSAGLNRFDRVTGTFTHFKHDPRDPSSLGGNDVESLYEDRSGVLWIGTEDGGLNRFDPSTEMFQQYRRFPDAPYGLSDVVRAICEDDSGALWVGTAAGLDKLDTATGTFRTLRHVPDDPTSLSYDIVLALYKDREGALWIGTEGGGLDRFNQETETFTHFRHDPEDPRSLSHPVVLVIYEDRQGTLWIGTAGGLNRLDRSGGQFSSYRTQDGLPSDVIYGILEDDQGNLWLSTDNGLSRFDPIRETFHNYDVSDGLQSNGFNTRAYFKGARGEMFFGGVNGFNAFFPQQIKENSNRPPIVVTAFKKGNQTVQADLADGQAIELSFTDRFISFEFAALDYAAPEKNQYAYMLEGQDKEWIETGTRRHVDYTNLRGGKYIFRVKGSNNHGVWNEVGTALYITVTPPFWETWWFRGGIALVLAGTVIGGYQLRVRRIQTRSLELEDQVKKRTNELEKRTHELEQRTTELGALYEADEKLYRHLRLDQLLQTLVDTAVDILDADKSSLLVWDDEREQLILRAAHGFSSKTIAQMSFAPGEGTIGLVAITGELAIVQDTRIDPRVAKRITEVEGIRSFMHVPIKIGGKIFGVFNVDYLEPRAFGADEQRLFTALSQRAALAIENAQLYERVEQAAVLEERQRLARELHDSVSQALYGIVLGTRTARTLLDREPVDEKAKAKLANPLDYIISLADAGLAEMRALIFELRPDALKTEGLVAALDRMASAQHARHSLEIHTELDQEPELTLVVKEALYRIAQEALNNIVKHAHAQVVHVRLKEQEGWITLEMQDDGVGFDTQGQYPGHMGLQSMRERTERLGGRLELTSAPGQGTLVRARVPL